MLDSDLALLYRVETKNLNKAMKRNIERFPENFCFQLRDDKFKSLRFQIGTSKEEKGGRRYLPYAFTEQGISMLSAVLRSSTAIKVSIAIINAFVSMRHYLVENELIFKQLGNINFKLSEHDESIAKIFKLLGNPSVKKSALFFQGQMFEAFSLLVKIIREAKQSIILIDNYIDTATLDILSKKRDGVAVKIVTKESSKLSEHDLKTFNRQYSESLSIRESSEFHDRFLILDGVELYHIGASLKDAGKKCFEISVIDDKKQLKLLLERIEVV